MKQYGILGKGSGKLGSSVFAISGGEQIVRQYNPVVSNPNTPAQVAQRAKLKLMSQIAADLAPIIAIPKDGLKSTRNIFVSKNIGLATYENNEAQVDVAMLQITAGSGFLGEPMIQSEASGLGVSIRSGVPEGIDKVVYVLLTTGDDFQLRVVDSAVVEVAGAGRTFPFVFNSELTTGFVLAYGIKTTTTQAGVGYADYEADTATHVATLVTTRKIKNAASSLTATFGHAFEL